MIYSRPGTCRSPDRRIVAVPTNNLHQRLLLLLLRCWHAFSCAEIRPTERLYITAGLHRCRRARRNKDTESRNKFTSRAAAAAPKFRLRVPSKKKYRSGKRTLFSRGRPQIGITFGRRYKVLHAGWRFCIASALSAICLEKEMMRGTMPGARRRGRSRTAWMDNIKTWAGLSAEESIRTTEDSDKWRKNVHGVANPRIEDG